MHVVLVPNNKTNERSNSLILKQTALLVYANVTVSMQKMLDWDYYHVKVGL